MSVDQNKIDFKAIRDAASKTAAKKSIDGTALPDKINFKAIREETLKKKGEDGDLLNGVKKSGLEIPSILNDPPKKAKSTGLGTEE